MFVGLLAAMDFNLGPSIRITYPSFSVETLPITNTRLHMLAKKNGYSYILGLAAMMVTSLT
jgi:hypothetical protein